MTRDVKATELNIAAALQEAASALAEAARSLPAAQELRPQGYHKPQPDWLPWHIARFCFLPRFADPKKDFASEMRLLVERCAGRGRSFAFDLRDPSRCVVILGQVALTIDSDDGEFSIDAIGAYEDPYPLITHDMSDPRGLPEEFFKSCDAEGFTLRQEYRHDAEALIDLSRVTWAAMRKGFRLALRGSSAHAFGRWGSVSEEFMPISVDQLLEFGEPDVSVMDDNWLLEYERRSVIKDPASNAVAVFSLHVAPQVSRGRSKGMKAEDNAIAALVDEMRAHPGRPKRKLDVKIKYVKEFGITSEGFKRVWQMAQAQVPGNTWGMPGPRRKRAC